MPWDQEHFLQGTAMSLQTISMSWRHPLVLSRCVWAGTSHFERLLTSDSN